MPRDAGLEEFVHSTIGEVPGLSEKAMFGGWAFLLHGNLLCGVRRGSVMLRIGAASEPWALALPGVEPVVMRGRRMHGYVRATEETFRQERALQRLVEAAFAFVATLPRK